MSFKRSPSKVWWASESLEFREVSSSPGSQDSGFSDTEGSPHNSDKNRKSKIDNEANEKNDQDTTEQNNNTTPKPLSSGQIDKNIFKGPLSNLDQRNLASNYKEKTTPIKTNFERLVKSEKKSPPPHSPEKAGAPATEPIKKQQRYIKHSPKVSRNLFVKECPANQYSDPIVTQGVDEEEDDTNEAEPNSSYYDTSSEISGTKSLPLAATDQKQPRDWLKLAARSAPEVFYSHEEVASFDSASSELEHIFEEFHGPGYTSTPKGGSPEKMRIGSDYRNSDERVPPIPTDGITVDDKAVSRWLEEARLATEQECTITLQCKSIAAELCQKVGHLAACATTILRGLISHTRCIEMDYQHLNSDSKYIGPLVQSVAGNILDFLKTHTSQVSSRILKLHDQIRHENALQAITDLYKEWERVQRQILVAEVKKLVDKLEDPTSEIDLRATLTGITSMGLKNPDLIEHFVKADIIPILLILCEKCKGSSVRSLILRCLSTMCSNASAIRHFEKFSGVQIIADTLEEDARPEPERSEAIALLAQVTAPWLEDNHTVKGLEEYSKTLVQSLTKFVSSTRCCQNLLLCAAALANLSCMDANCIKHLIKNDTASVLLLAVKNRGPLVSIYLLEQVATLLANMSVVEAARCQLTASEAPLALLHFLRWPRLPQNEDVERRLQQKSIIALSRMCGDRGAARQVVQNGGLARLVQLCREKKERFSSDAVLVAALATLRKIAESCGKDVLNEQDCQELVEPKLLDSFLAYSTQNESYV